MATPKGPLERTTITLPPAHMAALKEFAVDHFAGNVSQAVRELIATSDVTKSLVRDQMRPRG